MCFKARNNGTSAKDTMSTGNTAGGGNSFKSCSDCPGSCASVGLTVLSFVTNPQRVPAV
ncbi:uncharacterized protein BDV14DRAFT_181210 [Aspergillus stella-maris]|uniref:uncharacterized protein n=1 Tax=Aspergillus stella-maris TaxID=1810926 RepID=UPI003CCD5DE5